METQEAQLDYFTQTRIGVLIDVATKKLSSELVQMKDKLEALEREVTKIKTAQTVTPARTIEFPKFEQQMPQQQQSMQQPRPMMQQPQQQQRPPQQQDTPRYGNYTSQDVSIEKFFNYGRKK
mgnify:CR=1 FL=1